MVAIQRWSKTAGVDVRAVVRAAVRFLSTFWLAGITQDTSNDSLWFSMMLWDAMESNASSEVDTNAIESIHILSNYFGDFWPFFAIPLYSVRLSGVIWAVLDDFGMHWDGLGYLRGWFLWRRKWKPNRVGASTVDVLVIGRLFPWVPPVIYSHPAILLPQLLLLLLARSTLKDTPEEWVGGRGRGGGAVWERGKKQKGE